MIIFFLMILRKEDVQPRGTTTVVRVRVELLPRVVKIIIIITERNFRDLGRVDQHVV